VGQGRNYKIALETMESRALAVANKRVAAYQ
jgi:hypothetical protein